MSHDRRRNRRRKNNHKKNYQNKPETKYNCPICAKPIRDLNSAIATGEESEPAHFECAIKNIRQIEAVKPEEKICYLGGGCFGIIEKKKNPNSKANFIIKKKIQFEKPEMKLKWREELSEVNSINISSHFFQ